MITPASRDPYNTALRAVRRFAETGRFAPGEPLVITELAEEVGLSPTPVREALARLSGEGLIDRRRGRGYFYPAPSPADLIDLFELQRAYVHAALTLYPRGIGPLRKAAIGIDPLDGVQALFAAIIGQSANAALRQAHGQLSDRLRAVITAERALADNEAETVRGMIAEIIDGRIPALLARLADHHDQRCARAARLRTTLDRTAGGGRRQG